MALQKTKPYKYGLTTTYWSIDVYPEIDFLNQNARITLYGWLSEDSKKLDRQPRTDQFVMEIYPDTFNFAKDANNVEIAYNHIKGTADFADAEDV